MDGSTYGRDIRRAGLLLIAGAISVGAMVGGAVLYLIQRWRG